VAVDTVLTPELVQEGYARDLVRIVNTMRKDAGLALSDRIELFYEADGEVAAALSNFAPYIGEETLAVALQPGEASLGEYSESHTLGDESLTLSLRKA
jgi:isoleucyl-tRNA synthetase